MPKHIMIETSCGFSLLIKYQTQASNVFFWRLLLKMSVVYKLNEMDVGNEEKFYRLTTIGFLGIDFVLLVV